MSNLGYREIFSLDKLSLKQLNDTLRALWGKVMGNVDMRDLSDGARTVIGSKADGSVVSELIDEVNAQASLIEQTAASIVLAVNGLPLCGANLIGSSRSLALSAGERRAVREGLEGGARYALSLEGLALTPAGEGVLEARLIGSGEPESDALAASFPVGEGRQSAVFSVPSEEGRTWTLQLCAPSGAAAALSKAKLEKGDRATDWTPNAADPADALVCGTSVEVTGERFKVVSPTTWIGVPEAGGERQRLQIDGSGVTADRVESASVAPRLAGGTTVSVNPSATGGDETLLSLASALEALSGHMIDEDVVVSLSSGASLHGDAVLSGVWGMGSVTIEGNGASTDGALTLVNCGVKVRVEGLTFNRPDAIIARRCAQVVLDDLLVVGDGTGVGVLAEASTVAVTNSEISCCEKAVRAEDGSNLRTGAIKGSNDTYSVECSAAHACCSGTIPLGTARALSNGTLNASGCTATAGVAVTPTVPPVNLSFTAMNSGWYQTGWSSAETQVRQGYSQGGEFTGAFWFDNVALSQVLASATLTSASLQLSRKSGFGTAGEVAVRLYGITAPGKSGAPGRSAYYGVLGYHPAGATRSYALPLAAVNDLVSGAVNGLALYAGDGQVIPGQAISKNFAVFHGFSDPRPPILRITAS